MRFCNYFPTRFKQVKFNAGSTLSEHLPAILSETCRRSRNGRSVNGACEQNGSVYWNTAFHRKSLLRAVVRTQRANQKASLPVLKERRSRNVEVDLHSVFIFRINPEFVENPTWKTANSVRRPVGETCIPSAPVNTPPR